nr:50S ribosomal protein L11 methyltransferase [Mogibacterium timidum]
MGIDIDKDAVAAANENLELNDVRNVTIKQGDLTEGLDYKADIVVANLLTNLVIRLTADVRKHLNDGGIYIMSGILISQEEKVLEMLRANGFKCLEIAEQGEWCGIAAQLKK